MFVTIKDKIRATFSTSSVFHCCDSDKTYGFLIFIILVFLGGGGGVDEVEHRVKSPGGVFRKHH